MLIIPGEYASRRARIDRERYAQLRIATEITRDREISGSVSAGQWSPLWASETRGRLPLRLHPNKKHGLREAPERSLVLTSGGWRQFVIVSPSRVLARFSPDVPMYKSLVRRDNGSLESRRPRRPSSPGQRSARSTERRKAFLSSLADKAGNKRANGARCTI